MQILFDFLPVIAFFGAYELTNDIFVATGVIIVATVLQVSIHWLRTRRFKRLHLISAALVLVFGGLTLLVHDPIFIMWKVTVGVFVSSWTMRVSPLFRTYFVKGTS